MTAKPESTIPTALLTELKAAFAEMERLDALERERQATISTLGKRARAGEVISEQERRAVFDVTVVDYGDVWDMFKRLSGRVRKLPLTKRTAQGQAPLLEGV